MGIHPGQLRQYVITPALQLLEMASPAAEALLLGTAAQESHMGRYLHQLGNGPALGPFQMEPATYRDIWSNFIQHRPAIQQRLGGRWPMMPLPDEMVTDLLLAAVMCRLHYRRISAPLPDATDLPGLARYWKRYYNTPAGRGTEAEFIHNWHQFVKE